ncbi:MAG: hypothetical protein RSA51_07245 [Niameybacter sp.]
MGTYRFSSYKQLKKYVDAKLVSVLDEIADEVLYELKASVEDHLYSWEPKKYERTGWLLESITRSKVALSFGEYKVSIYYDTNVLQPVLREDAWNAHADFWGEWVGEDLVWWLEKGTPDNPYYQHPEYAFIRDCTEWISGEYHEKFKKKLEARGLLTV